MQGLNQPGGLQQWVREIEQHIIVLSGPLLATSGIIAGLDVVTNNFIAHNAPGVGAVLGLIWAICLMLTLDFQVLVLGVRARRVYISNKSTGKKVFEMVLAFAIALALGYVSLQMGSIFSRMMGTALSMEQAQMQLGINPIWLVYERSAMVMLLIFMSGWLRDDDPVQDVYPNPITQPTSISDETMRVVLAKLEKLDHLELALEANTTRTTLPERIEDETPGDLPVITPLEQPSQGEPSEQNYGPRIQWLYKENPEITIPEIVEQVGCSKSTAQKWLQRCKPAAE